MKKVALLFSLFIFLIISCSKEELQTENSDFVASEMLSNKEIKENPSVLNSVKFQKINAINKETNKKRDFLFQKNTIFYYW
jgi:hypothetical protein